MMKEQMSIKTNYLPIFPAFDKENSSAKEAMSLYAKK